MPVRASKTRPPRNPRGGGLAFAAVGLRALPVAQLALAPLRLQCPRLLNLCPLAHATDVDAHGPDGFL